MALMNNINVNLSSWIIDRSKSLSQEIPKHNCFLNWKQASTAMEADGIVEGFSKSVEMHGLKFNKLIGNIIYYFNLPCNELQLFS